MSNLKTYTRTFGTSTVYGVTLEVVGGIVLEHPFNSLSGGGYGRKHKSDDPAALMADMCAALERDGYTLQANR